MRWLARLFGPAHLSAIGRRLRGVPGISWAIEWFDRRRSARIERGGDAAELAKSRWRATDPNLDLTWGQSIDGDAFVERAASHGAFADDRRILEVGPGYGRILRSLIESEVPFERYVGLDISPRNVRDLRATFDDPRVEFLHGDVETTSLDDGPFDTVLSSLVFKHLYPGFDSALANLRHQVADGGVVLFDLIEGSRRYFHWDGRTYVREYSRGEIREILARNGLRHLAFDTVAHDADHARLLVVASPE